MSIKDPNWDPVVGIVSCAFAKWRSCVPPERDRLRPPDLVAGSFVALNLALTKSANRTVINSTIASTSQLWGGGQLLPGRSPGTGLSHSRWGFCSFIFAASRSQKLQNVMAVTEVLALLWQQKRRPEHGSDSREMAMEKKLMFVAFGYLLVLAALDASVAAMIVSG